MRECQGTVACAGYLGGFFLRSFGVFQALGNGHPGGPAAAEPSLSWTAERLAHVLRFEITLDRSVTSLGQRDRCRNNAALIFLTEAVLGETELGRGGCPGEWSRRVQRERAR